MSKSAAVVSIDIKANTATMSAGLNEAKRKFGELGQHGVSNMQATSAALRVLEGNMTSNIRAAERFLGSIRGVGGALQAVFPAVGSIALLGVLSEMVEKANRLREAYLKVQEAPTAISSAFASLNSRMQLSNDELDVTNARLEMEIAKLEGKPKNGLQLALHEAVVEADKFAAAIDRDLDEMQKLVEAQGVTGMTAFFTNTASSSGIGDSLKEFHQQINALLSDKNDKVREGTTLEEKNRAALRGNLALYEEYGKKIASVTTELSTARQLQQQQNEPALVNTPVGAVAMLDGRENQAPKIALLTRELKNLRIEWDAIGKSERNSDLTQRVSALGSGVQKQKSGDPYAEKLQEFQRELEAAREKSEHTGDAIGEALAKGSAKGQAAIDQITRQLKEEDKVLTNSQRLHLILAAESVSLEEASAERKAQAAMKASEAQKKAFEDVVRAQQDQEKETSRLDQLAEERQKREIERIEKLRGEMAALQYATDALHGGREAQFQAQLQGIRAKGRELGTPQGEVDSEVQSATAQHNLENDKLGIGESARDGFRDFFHEFEENTKSAGQMVKTTLGGAFEGINQQLGNLITGQKTSWEGLFRGLAAQFANFALQIAESALMKSLAGALGGSSGSGIGGFLGKLLGGARASGGDVDPGHSFLVGEKGPELFVPGASGTIIPNHSLNGGRQSVMYMIDARGADEAAVEQRVQRSLVAVHGSAVRSASIAAAEQARRQPR